jgi:hypothetical protein
MMSAQVLSDVAPQSDIRAPQELASRRIVAPRSGWGRGFFTAGTLPPFNVIAVDSRV